jgi:selenophosphate synthetase-related protein
MKTVSSRATAEARVVSKYRKLYAPLIELVNALQDIEPGGTLVDDVTLMKKEDGSVRITYVAKPIMLTISDKNRVFILRVIEAEKS